MRKFAAMLIGLCLFMAQVMAQNRLLTGKVTDEKGFPIVNASVVVKGTSRGVKTATDGSFSISVSNTAKALVVTSINFTSQDVVITGSTIVVKLLTSTASLDEVVVTGYTRQKKSQFSGAASVIDVKGIETVPVGAFDQAFQGRVPGMLVNSSSGQPGTSAAITIRGTQSISGVGVQPLFILDGVPLPAGDMKTLNPDDFESITVLKDAASAGIYGARGGLGVIVITTKKGKSGMANFTYRSQLGYTQKPNFDRLNLMSTAEMLTYEEREKLAGTPGWVYSPLNPAIPAGYTAAAKQASLDSIKAINSFWPDILYRTGVSQTHELNMSGGSEKTRFYLSGGYFDQQGIDLGSALTRYTTRFNIEHVQNNLTVNFNMGLGYSQTLLSEGELLGNSARNPFQMTYRAKPYENPYKADGSYNFGASNNLNLKAVANLLEGIQNSKRYDNQIKLNSGLTLAYKILPFLTARNTLGIDVNSENFSRYINPNSYIGSLQTFQNGIAQEASRVVSNLINTSSLIFSKSFGKHDIEAGAYFEVVRNYQKGIGFTLYNLDGRLTETGQGAGALPVSTGQTTYPQNATSAKSGYGIRSYFGTLRYTYAGKYTLNGTLRRDGTSRIVNVDNKEVTNWSAGFTWDAIKEKFMKSQSFVTDLKVRASYGIVPNIGSITTSTYGVYLFNTTNYTGPQVPSFGTTSYAGSSVTGLYPSSVGNPNLKIETIRKANLGVDVAVWQSRAKLTVDAYYNRTVDLFVNQTIPAEAGQGIGASIPINAGVMSNKGLEFNLSVDVVKNRNFGFTVSWNHAININKIEDLGQVSEYVSGTSIIRKGLAYGTAYTYNYLGADPATGNPRYYLPDGKTETFDQSKAGQFAFSSYLPKHVGGINLDFRYKAFAVTALFSYQTGVYRYDNTRNWITRGTPGYQATVRGSRELLTEQWEKAGDVKLYQSSAFDRGFTSSDLNNAKFMRFRNLNVMYNIPSIKTASGKTIIKSARFYVQAQNLAIWSPWKGLDPEDDNNISLNEYPNPKALVMGLDINF